MRLSCTASTALLTLCVSLSFRAVYAQRRNSGEPPEKGDTIASARIVVMPALERYDLSRLDRGVNNKPAVAVFTTAGPVARSLAVRVQGIVGGPLIPLERAHKSVEDFTRVLIDSIVEKTARTNMNRLIVLVAEPEIVLPFVRGSLSERGQAVFDQRKEKLATFTVFIRADRTYRLWITPLPPW